MSNLAGVYVNTGRFAEAEKLNLRALQGREKVLGPEHPDTLISVNNLAALYHTTGQFSEAEPLYLRALQAREKVLGPEHPDTLISVNSLAGLYHTTGRLLEAEPLYLRALQAREKVLGPEHPDTLISVNNLAQVYQETDRLAEAERLFLQALEARKQVLGLEHPDTLVSVNNLAALYHVTGRFAEAEPLYLKALEGLGQALGPEHPSTLSTVGNVAEFYREIGRFAEAEPLYLKALEGLRQVLGSDHPDTIFIVSNLAILNYETGRFAEAERLFYTAHTAREKVLGADHPNTLASLVNLAEIHKKNGQLDDAEKVYLSVLKTSEHSLGPDHPISQTAVNNLGNIYLSAGRTIDAEELLLRALETSKRIRGEVHPYTLSTMMNLAETYKKAGRFKEAEAFYASALRNREQVLGPEHPDTLSSLERLARFRLSLASPEGVASSIASLDEGLTSWAQRVQGQVSTGANDALRADLLEEIDLRDIALSAAFAFEEHTELGARALLLTKGIAGETDAALTRLVTVHDDPQVREMAEELRRAETLLHASYQGNDPDWITTALRDRDAARLSLFKRIDPPLAFNPEAIIPDAVSAALEPGTVFLDYGIYVPVDFESGDRSEMRIVLAAYQADAPPVVLDLGPASTLTEAILATTDHAANRSTPLFAQHWQLRKVLLDPVDELLVGAQEVIIAPDGILARVNFAMLQDPQNHNQHLVQRVSVRNVASGRSLLSQDILSPEAEAGFFGAGLTDFGPYDEELCANAPTRNGVGGLCPLVTTVEEVSGISTLFEQAGHAVRPALLETAATESAVTAAMPGSRFIHLATHGGPQLAGFDGESLHNIGLAFHGLGTDSDAEQIVTAQSDGILSGYEAARLQLWGTDMVVMSACDTALGEEAGSEGIWSMAYAFRLAGASTVMMTLWTVDDTRAPIFMTWFYEELLQRQLDDLEEPVNATLRAALRKTRLRAIEDGWSYWDYGPYVLMES